MWDDVINRAGRLSGMGCLIGVGDRPQQDTIQQSRPAE